MTILKPTYIGQLTEPPSVFSDQSVMSAVLTYPDIVEARRKLAPFSIGVILTETGIPEGVLTMLLHDAYHTLGMQPAARAGITARLLKQELARQGLDNGVAVLVALTKAEVRRLQVRLLGKSYSLTYYREETNVSIA